MSFANAVFPMEGRAATMDPFPFLQAVISRTSSKENRFNAALHFDSIIANNS